MCLSRHLVQCSFQTNRVTLQQTEKFKYLGVVFSSDGRQDNELNNRIRKASAVMCQFYRSVVLKQELCTKAKLIVFRSVFVSIPTYSHECWVMTERYRVPKRVSCKQLEVYPYLIKLEALTFVNFSTSNRY